MQITINVPDEYIPGVVATMYASNRTRNVPYSSIEEFLTEYAISICSSACMTYKVGPYWEGPVMPDFNPDGTPFEKKSEDEVQEEDSVIEDTMIQEPITTQSESNLPIDISEN